MIKMNKFGKVAVLMGGKSKEREVSIKSGNAVLASLIRQGVDAYAFDPANQPLHDIESYDLAMISLHGRFGEDGSIQGALELLGIPYTGSGVMASAIGMDKLRTKMIWKAAGIPTPAFQTLSARTNFTDVALELGLPLFVKPSNEGSSIGISKVNDIGALQGAYELAKKSDPLVIAEAFIGGGEYTVGILGDESLPIVRIVPSTEFYDYEAKYLRDDTKYHCPCGLDKDLEMSIRQDALCAFRAIGGTGWGRVDFLMDENRKHYFLEVNTSPGMTDHSLVPMAAKAAGITFDQLVMKILNLANRSDEKYGEVFYVG